MADEFPEGRLMTPEDIENFIVDHGIDENAGQALRDCPPELQVTVIDQGPIGNARNPSSVLLSRIREAENSVQDHHDSGRPVPEGVEEFLRQNPVDDKAAGLLRNCDPSIAESVMAKGISYARNPSAFLMARIRDEEKELEKRGGGGKRRDDYPQPRDDYPQPARQQERGWDKPSRGYDEPESYTVPRRLLGDLQEFLRASLRGTNGNWADDLLRHLDDIQGSSSAAPFRSGDDHHRGRSRSRSRRYDKREGDREGDRSRHDRYHDPHQDKVEAFLRSNNVDDKAAEALRQCDPKIAQVVMDKGIATARNPSGALLARIQDVRKDDRPSRDDRSDYGRDDRGDHRAPRRGGSRLDEEVQAWLKEANVDDRAADALLECVPDLQKLVIEKDVKGARNPSSALLARIRNCRERFGY